MTAERVEAPSPPWVELFAPAGPETQQLLLASNAKSDPLDSIREAFMSERLVIIQRAKEQLSKATVLTADGIVDVLDAIWHSRVSYINKFIGPSIAEAYIKAFRSANQGDVPIQLIYALAEQHVRRTGDYFHKTSAEALAQGFNTFVNRQIPARAALNRVIDGYGMTPRQMSGLTSAKYLENKVENSLPRAIKDKVRNYINKSVTQRLSIFARQEAHNLSQQAQQVSWMWMVEHDKLPQTAEKMWITAQDERVCGVCGPLHRTKVPVGERFILDDGQKLYVPGAHTNCRCTVRLQIPQFHIVKNAFGVIEKAADFDPKEHPRDKDGKFAAVSSDEITEDDINHFSDERCMDLALAIHEKTNWPLIAVYDYEVGEGGWIHVGVETPKGEFLDVTGTHSMDETYAQWSDLWGQISDVDLGEISVEEVRGNGQAKVTPRALNVAKKLLPDEFSKADDDDFDPKEHPRGAGGRFVRANNPEPERQPAPEASPEPELAEREPATEQLQDIAAQARRVAEQNRVISELLLRASLDLPQAEEARQVQDLPFVDIKPVEVATVEVQQVQELAEAQPVELVGAEASTVEAVPGTAVELAAVPVDLPGRQRVEIDVQAMLRAFAEQDARESALRPTSVTQMGTRDFDNPLYAILPYFVLDKKSGKVVITDDEYFAPASRGMLETDAVEEYDNFLTTYAATLKSDKRHILFEHHPPQGRLHARLSDDDIFKVLDVTANANEDWASNQYVPLAWYTEDGHWDHTNSRVSALEVAELMGVDKEDFEIILVRMEKGYKDARMESEESMAGYELWRAPGTYKIISDYRDRQFSVPVRIVNIEPDIKPTILNTDVEPPGFGD